MPIDYAVNIMSVYRRASDDVRASDWYGNARRLALELSPDDVWRGAGVISALSPRKRWPENERIARLAFSTGIATGNMPMHNTIAQKILDGIPWSVAQNGAKTRSFTEAIATGGNGLLATIDCHAYDIAMGHITPEKQRRINKTAIQNMQSAYHEVAVYLGITDNRAQAITWEWWRMEKGIV